MITSLKIEAKMDIYFSFIEIQKLKMHIFMMF
jgi:hypothetical protein